MFRYTLSTPETRATTAILVAPDLLRRVGEIVRDHVHATSCVIFSDATVNGFHGGALANALRQGGIEAIAFTFEPGEASKCHQTALRAYDALSAARIKRDVVIVALGGGVVSDVAGFVAATWMRGVSWIVCPTTMEAMVDAAIGGKTAVNLPAGKNLVGAFHHPALVLIDPTTLSTLPQRDLRAGVSESVKHAALFDDSFLAWQERHVASILSLDPTTTVELIARNVRFKADIVADDPYDRTGRRSLLNFGHTIGHAIEAACDYRLRHGECVAIGMVAAGRLSSAVAGLPATDAERITALLRAFGLPTKLSDHMDAAPVPSARKVLDVMLTDKKHVSAKSGGAAPRWVLLEALGRPTVRPDVPQSLVEEVVAEALH